MHVGVEVLKILANFEQEANRLGSTYRSSISGVLVQKTKTNVEVTVTNGVWLVTHKLPIESFDLADRKGSLFFDATQCSKAKSMLKLIPKSWDSIDIELDGNTLFHRGIGLTFTGGSDYPDFSNILPVIPEDKSFEVTLNPKLLLELADAIHCILPKRTKSRDSGITLRFNTSNPMTPIQVLKNGMDTVAVAALMPIRK